MKTTPPPRPSSPPPQNDEDRRGLTPSERLRILSLLRNASDRRGTPPKSLPPPPPSSWKQTEDHSARLAIKIEERLSDLVWDLMDDEGKAPRFSESYYIQRERFQKVLLDVVCTSDQYDKAIKNLHALLDTLNDPDAPLWRLGYPHPLTPIDFLENLKRKLFPPNLSK